MGGASISKDNDFAQHSSFRDMYEQKRSVLGGGGASLVVQSRLHLQAKLELDIVCCALPVRFRTWSHIAATLVGPAIISSI